MIGRVEHLDFSVLHEFYLRTVPERYHVRQSLLESHFQRTPLLNLDASRWATFTHQLVGAALIKFSASRLYPGPEPLQAHLGLLVFKDYAAAQELWDAVEPVLRASGIQKVIFGQENLHLFPGAPKDWPELGHALEKLGFAPAETEQFDLERDLADYVLPESCALGEGIVVRPCAADDLTELTRFFDEEFPGRWKYDSLQKWQIEGPQTIMGLFENGRCEGFALIQSDGCQLPIGGAVWNQDLGANWGSLGPIGVSKGVRGRGLGDALLAHSLVELKTRGARKTIIDWTTLGVFYGRHGFEISRRYTTYTKDLT